MRTLLEFVKTGNIKKHKLLSDLNEGDKLYFASLGYHKPDKIKEIKDVRYKVLEKITEDSFNIQFWGLTISLTNNTKSYAKSSYISIDKDENLDVPYAVVESSVNYYILTTYPDGIVDCINDYNK